MGKAKAEAEDEAKRKEPHYLRVTSSHVAHYASRFGTSRDKIKVKMKKEKAGNRPSVSAIRYPEPSAQSLINHVLISPGILLLVTRYVSLVTHYSSLLRSSDS